MTLAPLISSIYGLGLNVLSGKVEGLPEPNKRMTEQQLTPNLTLHALRLPAILPGSSLPEGTLSHV